MKENKIEKKIRAPHAQLVEAGKIAREMLIKKGIMSAQTLDDLKAKVPNAPIFPGLPEYLPHRWTIKAAQRTMYDILIMWKDQCKKKNKKEEDISEFFKFAIKTMQAQEKKLQKKVNEMGILIKTMQNVPVLKEIFAPVRSLETLKGMGKFFVDSFAVSVIVKSNESTSEYAMWFLDWTESLYNMWGKQNDGLENKQDEQTNKKTTNNKKGKGDTKAR